jgi:hypothetical protein
METRKIACACFVGGSLTAALAFYLAPMFWWLGILAGAAAGYLGYEFREALRAIPIAYKKAHWEARYAWEQLKRPHPLLIWAITVLALVVPPYIWFAQNPSFFVDSNQLLQLPVANLLLIHFMSLFVIGATPFLIGVILAGIGMDWPLVFPRNLTVREFFLALFLGARRAGVYACLDMWVALARKVRYGVLLAYHFCIHLFILIHSDNRLICAVDAPLGGMIAFLVGHRYVNTLADIAVIVIGGGLLAAALGVVNKKYIARLVQAPHVS